jgi:hypothetical protein
MGLGWLTELGWPAQPGQHGGMRKPSDPRHRHRFQAGLISHAVWLYHVFSLSFRGVELPPGRFGSEVSPDFWGSGAAQSRF